MSRIALRRALDLHDEAQAYWFDDAKAMSSAEFLTGTARRIFGGMSMPSDSEWDDDGVAAYLAGAQRAALNGEIVWVSADVVNVATHLAVALPDEADIHADDIWLQSGMLLLEAPVGVPGTQHCSPFELVAVSWVRGANGVFVTTWEDRIEGTRDRYPGAAVGNPANLPRLVPQGLVGNTIVARGYPHASQGPMPPSAPTGWMEGAAATWPMPSLVQKIAYTLLVMMGQKIVAPERGMRDRNMRRGAARRKVAPKDFTVIRLRRSRSTSVDPDAHRDVEWTHRWIVNAHWRQQWYPSTQSHRRIPIAAYVKGPEHLPLLDPPRVYALVR